MSAARLFWLAYVALLALAMVALSIVLSGCSTTGRPINNPPYVGADCITDGGHLVQVIGAMPGGWWWVKGDPSAPWMVSGAQLGRCL